MAYLVTRTSHGPAFPRGIAQAFAGFGSAAASPVAMDVRRTDSGYTVEIPVPGFAPSQIEASLEEGVLTVKGDAENRRFSRSLQVPDEIDPETISAKVEHGLLTLTLNVQAKLAPRKIEISAN